jgi:hypothetical protein
MADHLAFALTFFWDQDTVVGISEYLMFVSY